MKGDRMQSRRRFIKAVGVAGAAAFLPWRRSHGELSAEALPGGTLAPALITKYVTARPVPAAMPRTGKIRQRKDRAIDYYEIGVRQFRQQILPPGMPMTTVWGYGSVNDQGSFRSPGLTLEAKWRAPVRVNWINGLVDASGNFLPHLFAVDPTLHWANPPGPRDERPEFESTPGPYRGPVPIVTHLHGGHSTEESDGFMQAWYLPAARNIPAGYFSVGTRYEAFKAEFEAARQQTWAPGSAVFQYGNDQRATTLWYHDHTMGLNRVSIYAGLAGLYILRGGPSDLPAGLLPGPAPAPDDAPGTPYYEIPLNIQDRSFNADGSLFYPDSRLFFDGFAGPYIPGSDISPISNPQEFSNTIVVNGQTWPRLMVEPRRYRFRLLNSCGSRFLMLKLVTDPLAARPAAPELPLIQIGSGGGFLPTPVPLGRLLLAPAERADVLVDFSGLAPGREIFLINEGPDEPFDGGEPASDVDPADPGTTGQVLKFTVGPLLSPDASLPADQLTLPAFTALPGAVRTRRLSLNEAVSDVLAGVGPRAALLGIVDGSGNPVAMMPEDPVTETPRVNETETWEP